MDFLVVAYNGVGKLRGINEKVTEIFIINRKRVEIDIKNNRPN